MNAHVTPFNAEVEPRRTAALFNKVFAAILVLINVLLPSLALSILKKGTPLGEVSHDLAAWSELGISLLGFYAAGAVFLNSYFGRVLLPLGKPLGLIHKGPKR